MQNEKNYKNLIMYIVLVLVGAALFVSAQSIEVGTTMGKGGDFMPKVCTTAWLILSIILLISEYRKNDIETKPMNSVKGLLLTIGLLIIYIGLIDFIVFTFMSIVYLITQMYLFLPKEKRNKKQYIRLAIIAVVAPILVNWLFVNVFSLILPSGLLF